MEKQELLKNEKKKNVQVILKEKTEREGKEEEKMSD